MSSTNPNLFTLNPKYFATSSFQNFHSPALDDFASTKSVWMIEKTEFQEKLQMLQNELNIQKEINKKLGLRVQELEALMQRTKNKEHQRVYSIPSCNTLNNLSSHNILNSFLMGFPEHKHKKTPFLSSSKFMEDIPGKQSKETENQGNEKKRLHHQKSNSFNTKSLVIVETTNREQKTDFTTIHVNIQEGVLSSKNASQHGRHLFHQKKSRKKTPTAFESNSNSTTNLSNSNVSNSGFSSHDAKPKGSEDPAAKDVSTANRCSDPPQPSKAQARLSFITTEKSLEINETPQAAGNPYMSKNIANCYIFMSPAQRQKLMSMPIRRKWVLEKGGIKNNNSRAQENIKNDVSSDRCLTKDSYMTKSAKEFPVYKSIEKKGTHLYRQGTSITELKAFNRKQLNPKLTVKAHLDSVRGLALSTDKTTLITASEDNNMKLWDIKDFERNSEAGIEPFLTLRGEKGAVLTLDARDSWIQESSIPMNTFFSAGVEGVIRSWNVPRKEEVTLQRKSEERSFPNFEWKAHEDAIWDLKLHPYSDLMTSASSDGCIKLWKFQGRSSESKGFDVNCAMTFSHKLGDNPDIPTSMVWLDQIQGICSGYVGSKSLVIFDSEEKLEVKDVLSFSSDSLDYRTNKVIFDPALKCVISGHEDKNIRLFDLSSKKLVKSFIAHNDSVTSLSLSPFKPHQLISVSHDGSLRVWDLRKHHCLQELAIHRRKYDEAVQCLLSNKSLPFVITGGADSYIKILRNIEN